MNEELIGREGFEGTAWTAFYDELYSGACFGLNIAETARRVNRVRTTSLNINLTVSPFVFFQVHRDHHRFLGGYWCESGRFPSG